MSLLSLALLPLLALSVPAQVAAPAKAAQETPRRATEDWPRNFGPSGDSTAVVPGLNLGWGDAGPKIAWSVETGPGFGGVVIEGGEVFLLDRVRGESDILRCFDLQTGEELWSADYEAEGRLSFPGSRSVPEVTEDAVFTAGGFGHIACFDRIEQGVSWLVDMRDELGGQLPMFGWSAAPVLYEETVIVTPLGGAVGLAALDAFTGDTVWTTGSVGYSHSVPVVVQLDGVDQLLFLSTPRPGQGADRRLPCSLSSFDPRTGELLWKHDMEFCGLPIVAPFQVDEQHLFLTGGYRAGSRLLKMEFGEGGVEVETVFDSTRGAQIHPPILFEDHLYLLANENWNDRRNRAEGGLVCFGLDGEEKWRTGDDPFFGRGNAVLVNDRLVILDGHNGTLRTVRPDPKGFDLEAESAKVFDPPRGRDGQLWGPMAVAQGRLVLRSQEQLKCVLLTGEE